MNAVPGRAGRLAVVAALCGMVAALAAPHLVDVSAGPPDTDPIDPIETTEPDTPDTTAVEVTIESVPTSPPAETSTPTTLDGTETSEAGVEPTEPEPTEPEPTEPEPTEPEPTVAPSPKPDPAAEPTEPDGTVVPAAPDDTYSVVVAAVCVGGTTPAVDVVSTGTGEIRVAVGPASSVLTSASPTWQAPWPTDDRGNLSTPAKWDAVRTDTDIVFDLGVVDLPADCPPPPNTPSAPENFSTTPGDGSVVLSWSPPSSDGESAITDYVVEYNAYPVDDAWTTFDDGGATSGALIGGLENCVTYLFRVRADNINGKGEWIDGKDTPASVPCRPVVSAAPTNVSGQVALEWGEPPSGSNPVTDYVIEYTAWGSIVWNPIDDGVNTDTFYIVSGLIAGRGYSFRIAAMNASGISNYSPWASAIAQDVATPPRTLTATAANMSVLLSWQEPLYPHGSAVSGYVLQRSLNGLSWTTIKEGVTATSYRVTGHSNGVRFYFRVLASNAVGNSPPSNTASAIPRTMPTAPRSLSASATGVSGQVRLGWIAPLSNGGAAITDYVIYRSLDGSSGWTWVNDGVNTATTFTVNGLANGTRHYFRVFAVNAAGWSPTSSVVSAVPTYVLTAPRSLTATPTSLSGQLRLAWLAPLSNGGAAITDYVIYRSLDGSSGWMWINDGVSTATTFTVNGLANGTRHYFRVFAVNARRWSVSDVVSAVPVSA